MRSGGEAALTEPENAPQRRSQRSRPQGPQGLGTRPQEPRCQASEICQRTDLQALCFCPSTGASPDRPAGAGFPEASHRPAQLRLVRLAPGWAGSLSSRRDRSRVRRQRASGQQTGPRRSRPLLAAPASEQMASVLWVALVLLRRPPPPPARLWPACSDTPRLAACCGLPAEPASGTAHPAVLEPGGPARARWIQEGGVRPAGPCPAPAHQPQHRPGEGSWCRAELLRPSQPRTGLLTPGPGDSRTLSPLGPNSRPAQPSGSRSETGRRPHSPALPPLALRLPPRVVLLGRPASAPETRVSSAAWASLDVPSLQARGWAEARPVRLVSDALLASRRGMEGVVDSGTQTDAVVVLSLAQAAVLGLVSENELFGATISAEAFYPDLGPGLSGAAVGEPGPPGPDIYQLACNGRALEEPAEEEVLEVEAAFEKHTRRKTRPPVRLVPKVKFEKAEEEAEEVYEVSVPGGERGAGPAEAPGEVAGGGGCEPLVQSSSVKMIDLSAFSRKPRTLRPLPRAPRPELDLAPFDPHFPDPARNGFPEPSLALPGPEALPAECGFEPPALAPLGGPEAPALGSPEPVKPEQGFVWQEAGEFEADAAGSTVERHKKAQLDRLDINVQIDDSYLVEAGDRQKRWQCRMCEKSYTSKYNLVTHILGHNGIKPHSCPHCSKLFKQPSHLQTHLLTHQGTRPHKCQVCQKAFTQTSHLKRHMLLHSEVKPYSCHFCGRGFAYPSELKAHEVKHESGRCHVCVECGLDFSTLTQLKRHLASHQGPTLYQCLDCSKSFHYRSQLQNHMLKHQNVRPFVCTECGMEFSQIHHLKQHSLTHKVSPGLAPGRGRALLSPRRGRCPRWTHPGWRSARCRPLRPCWPALPAAGGARGAAAPCLGCANREGPRRSAACVCVLGQGESGGGLQTLACPRRPSRTEVHRLGPARCPPQGVKEFKCEVCGREFTLQANMKRHMLIHTSVRPYQCHICFKTFVQKQTLKTHMIVHSPVKPFKCKVCGKSFNRMYNLLGHMHLHAGSKPFKCPYCSSKFNLKGNLSRHMKVKHGVMDIGPDSQDPMMELTGTDPAELDSQQEMEDFEENAYAYTGVDGGAEASVLTEQAMKEMAYYNVL
ncbi:Zinc finger protein 710 [Galemys pyrenaicus]|uniref:Zinc finger protein 710 n=1 Tax=Galemys pyrenaicus TaxID=202257 RepID=A0A8J6AFN4_GALPY|nr:Zinc finger protein 710 [Galemys pyrenaicus]